MARRVGVSPSVIRSWENLGLTRPRRTRKQVSALYGRRREAAEAGAISAEGAGTERGGDCRTAAAGRAGASRGGWERGSDWFALAAIAGKAGSCRWRRWREAVGISVGFLSALERSQMSGSVGTLRKLARFYKTNILDFFDATGASSRQVQPEQQKGSGSWARACAWSCWHGGTR